MAKKKKGSKPASEYMTPAEAAVFLDRWAAGLNERHDARQRLRGLVEEFRNWLIDEGLNPDRLDAAQLRDLLRRREQDSAYRQGKRRSGVSRKGPKKVPVADLQKEYDRVRPYARSRTDAATQVAKKIFHVKGQPVNVSRNTVLTYTKEMRPTK